MKRSSPIRRTPLKRGTKRLRRHSMTNSRPNTDLDLRKLYRIHNQRCELERYLIGSTEWELQLRIDHGPNGLELHHVGRLTGVRFDILPLLIMTSGRAHRFCHNFPCEGLTACLLAKVRKGEYDRLHVVEVLGKDLVGIVAGYEFESEFWQATQTAVLIEVDG